MNKLYSYILVLLMTIYIVSGQSNPPQIPILQTIYVDSTAPVNQTIPCGQNETIACPTLQSALNSINNTGLIGVGQVLLQLAANGQYSGVGNVGLVITTNITIAGNQSTVDLQSKYNFIQSSDTLAKAANATTQTIFVQGLTVQNGFMPLTSGVVFSFGLTNGTVTSLYATDCKFSNNSVELGFRGAIVYVSSTNPFQMIDAVVSFDGCTIDKTSNNFGEGVVFYGSGFHYSVYLTNTIITNSNASTSLIDGLTVDIYSIGSSYINNHVTFGTILTSTNGNIFVNQSLFSGNVDPNLSQACIFSSFANLVVLNTQFINNQMASIEVKSEKSLIVDGCLFQDNTGMVGTAVNDLSMSNVSISNSVIQNNIATFYSSGVGLSQSISASLTNVTFVQNNSSTASLIYLDSISGDLKLSNVVFNFKNFTTIPLKMIKCRSTDIIMNNVVVNNVTTPYQDTIDFQCVAKIGTDTPSCTIQDQGNNPNAKFQCSTGTNPTNGSSEEDKDKKKSLTGGQIAGIILGVIFGIAIFICVIYIFYKRHQNSKKYPPLGRHNGGHF